MPQSQNQKKVCYSTDVRSYISKAEEGMNKDSIKSNEGWRFVGSNWQLKVRDREDDDEEKVWEARSSCGFFSEF